MQPQRRSNFAHLTRLQEDLALLGAGAERYFADDPNTCLLKLRQFGELMARQVAARAGIYSPDEDNQASLLSRLKGAGWLPRDVADLFHWLRKAGNIANHQFAGDHRAALQTLKVATQLGFWFQRSFGDVDFKGGAFVPPEAPCDESAALRAELVELRQRLQAQAERAESAEQQAAQAREDARLWEAMAVDGSHTVEALEARLTQQQAESAAQLAEQQAKAAAQSKADILQLQKQADQAAGTIQLDEKATRELIDQQLREAGWEADSVQLRYSAGTRPEAGRYLAIAEWPTASGPADYALFIGTDCVGVVEAKRSSRNVASAIDQARRYAEGLFDESHAPLSAQWGAFRVPLVFSTNGRPFQQQFREVSGIWFCDLRRSSNHRKALDGWYTPQGIRELLKQNIDAAETKLDGIGFKFGFPLREYQRRAILATEDAVKAGQQSVLLAMATGTGKTKTCIALVYRLLKAQRFRRILFLVDRTALGEQAANAFKETQMESLQRFADVFGIKEIDEQQPEADTKVHISTVQGLVKRVLYAEDGGLPVDAYDCIVVDECHRGYLLDREMSETEAEFRDQTDYISKYRRVLDHFDAVKIGLTATPALHTTEIFGQPAFVYSYREAVLDGHLIDHDPALRIRTELSEGGIHYKAGEDVSVYNAQTQQIDLFKTPDELDFDVSEFNRKVITEPFNRVVCKALTDHLNPAGPDKTLIFCATDVHADMVVGLLKDAFKDRGIEVEDDAILKITGASDKPLQLIRRFRNELNPVIAVTVDLLTTGIDVPSISNLVFLRRVNSRILYEQMLGRATRRCDEIGKEVFRIFDAVDLYTGLEAVNSMKPVVQNPSIGFSQLVQEIVAHPDDGIAQQAREQMLGKWQRKRRHLTDSQANAMKQAGFDPQDFAHFLKTADIKELAQWWSNHVGLGELLDRKRDTPADPLVVSSHEDSLIEVTPAYGRPDDYLERFAAFVKEKGNTLPALIAVVQRPRELTRRDLMELVVALENAGFDEKSLTHAWTQRSNHEIAARVLGFVRQAALGDPLVPFDTRVDTAVQRISQQRKLTAVQQDWLKRLAKQVKANIVLDETLINEGPFGQQGGFRRLNQIFDQQLGDVLADMNEAIWQSAANQ
ncbi:type I restriction-modification system endonuclease [Burkholderia cenocepacia]|uniref:type I restriction-modification system endonuclease n=1 Tax=Burkholderia cenocepacia TaxID=95486 RepID=UPI00264F3204|nr:type I restriction-modification system endonuclease [Burkholderia cenocepacia]MDN7549483.1 type I restriction-modification system endonuclease [Burkholderia cenocepacia]MDN7631690.1 type I restriction-modification system endonuclease [Burkholderia cenocepacia]